jgi:competence protein ComEA
MDELLTRLKRSLGEPGQNRKLLIALLVLVAAVVFVINSVSSGSASTGSASTGYPNAGPANTGYSNSGYGSSGSAISNSTDPSRPSVSQPSFYVHIVGEVKTPGVYSLEVGARLFDAIVAAGGFLDDAEQGSVNLARELTDGEQIVVLRRGQVSASGQSPGGSNQVSINRASQAELESLPGVGPALASRIIDWRAANGGFKKLQDLLNVGGIGDKLFAGLKKLISL